MKIILIDNYDSFTFNLYHYISSLGANVDVIRNDEITDKQIIKNKYDRIVISPGPGEITIRLYLSLIIFSSVILSFLIIFTFTFNDER